MSEKPINIRFGQNWLNNTINKSQQDLKKKFEEIDKKSDERMLEFSLKNAELDWYNPITGRMGGVDGAVGLGGSGVKFFPIDTPQEEIDEWKSDKVVGYIKEDVVEDNTIGSKYYFGDPSSATKDQNYRYYVPGPTGIGGWRGGNTLLSGVIDSYRAVDSQQLEESGVAMYTVWGEDYNETHKTGEYVSTAGTWNPNLNFGEGGWDMPHQGQKNNYYTWEDPYQLDFLRYHDDLTDGKYWWNFSGEDETAMSRDYIITPTGTKIYDRKVVLLKKHNFTENKDGNNITTEIYDSKPKSVTDEVAKYILNDGPPPPVIVRQTDILDPSIILNEELKTYDSNYFNKQKSYEDFEENVIRQYGSLGNYNKMVDDYLEHQRMKMKYQKEGWIIYYPEEKLSLTELNQYKNDIELFYDDEYVMTGDKSKSLDNGLFLDYYYNVAMAVPKLFGVENDSEIKRNARAEAVKRAEYLKSTLNWSFDLGNSMSLGMTKHIDGEGLGSDNYEKSNTRKFDEHLQFINALHGDSANIPKLWKQRSYINNITNQTSSLGSFVPFIGSAKFLNAAVQWKKYPQYYQWLANGGLFTTLGGIHDFNEQVYDKPPEEIFNRRFLSSRVMDFAVGSAFIPAGGGARNYGSDFINRWYRGSATGIFPKGDPTTISYQIASMIQPFIKQSAQIGGLSTLGTAHQYAEMLNHNFESGIFKKNSKGELTHIKNPSIMENINFTNQQFGQDMENIVSSQLLFWTIMHSIPVFMPKDVTMYRRKYTDMKNTKRPTGDLDPFKYEGPLSELKYKTVNGQRVWEMKDPNPVVGEVKLKLGVRAFRDYQKKVWESTVNQAKVNSEMPKPRGNTFEGAIESQQMWWNGIQTRDMFFRDIMNDMWSLEGKYMETPWGSKIKLTKDILRGYQSNWVQRYSKFSRNPNFSTFRALEHFEMQNEWLINATMNRMYLRSGSITSGINKYSLPTYRPYQIENQIRFQGEIPSNNVDITNFMKKNPLLKNMDIVYLPEKDLAARPLSFILENMPLIDLVELEGYKLINENGELANGQRIEELEGIYDSEGEELYYVEIAGQNTVEDNNSGQVILGSGTSKDALIEDGIVEPIYKMLEKVDPLLYKEINQISQQMKDNLIEQGIAGTDLELTELFSKAYTFNRLGYANDPVYNAVAETFIYPKEILNKFDKWVTHQTGESIDVLLGGVEPRQIRLGDTNFEPIENPQTITSPSGTTYSLKPPTNYSNQIYWNKSEAAIDKLNANSLKVQGVKNFLLRQGVPIAELEYMQLDEFLAGRKPTDSILKSDLKDWIARNKVDIEEVLLEDLGPAIRNRYDVITYGESYVEDQESLGSGNRELDEMGKHPGLSKYDAELIMEETIDNHIENELYDITNGDHPRFKFVGETEQIKDLDKDPADLPYKNQDEWEEALRTELMRDGEFEVVPYEYTDYERTIGNVKYGIEQGHESLQKPNGENYKELVFLTKGLETFDGGHEFLSDNDWRDNNKIFAHARMNDRWGTLNKGLKIGETTVSPSVSNALETINANDPNRRKVLKVLNIEESQSDWHHSGYETGYYSEEQLYKRVNEGWKYLEELYGNNPFIKSLNKDAPTYLFNRTSIQELREAFDYRFKNDGPPYKNIPQNVHPDTHIGVENQLDWVIDKIKTFHDTYKYDNYSIRQESASVETSDINYAVYGIFGNDLIVDGPHIQTFKTREEAEEFVKYAESINLTNAKTGEQTMDMLTKGPGLAFDRQHIKDWIQIAKGEKSLPEMAPGQDLEWLKLVHRRLIKYAIENGYDAISWIDGESSAKRYNAFTYLNEITYSDPVEINGVTRRAIEMTDKEGNPVKFENGSYRKFMTNKEISDYFGEAASGILENKGKKVGSVLENDVWEWKGIDKTILHLNGASTIGEWDDFNLSFLLMDGGKYNVEGSYSRGLTDGTVNIDRVFNNLEEAQEFFLSQAKQHRAGRLNEVIDAPDEAQYKLTGLDLVLKGKFHLSMYNEWTPNNFTKLGEKYGIGVETFPKEGNDFTGSRELIGQQVFVFNDKIKDAYRDKPIPTYQIKLHKFKNKDVEKRYSDAEVTNNNGSNFTEKTLEKVTYIKDIFTRKYPEMPRGGKFALANDILRRYEASKDFTQEKAFVYLNDIVGDLGPKQFHNFSRAVILRDLYSDYQQGKLNEVFGLSEEEFLAEYDAIQEIISKSPKIEKALIRRKEIQSIITNGLVDAGILDGDVVNDNPDYYHHQVLMYQQLLNSSGQLSKPKPGYSKERKGGYDFNTNYLEAEFLYMAGALKDIETVNILNEINNGYNIIDQVKQDHKNKTGSIKGWEASIPEGYEEWKPDKGSIFYTTTTINEDAFNEFISNADNELGFDANALDDLKELMSKTLVFGGQKQGMILPAELSQSLKNHFKSNESISLGAEIWKGGITGWKQWTLFNPRRAIKYNLNNISGDMDAVVAANPGVVKEIPEATIMLFKHRNNMYEDGTPQLYWDAVETGVFNGTFISQELSDYNKFDKLLKNKLKKEKTALEDLVGWYWDGTKELTAFRENQLRLAAYIYYRKRLDKGDSLKDIGYGGTNPSQLEGIEDNKTLAGILARNIVGDYGNISYGGQYLREYFLPFYSFQEINFKRYTNLFANTYKSGDWDNFKSSAWGAGKQGATAMWRFARIFWYYTMLSTWNNTGERKEINEKISDMDKTNLYLITGEKEDGTVRMLRTSGALDDYMQWYGGDEAKYYLEQLAMGKMTWDDIRKDIKQNPRLLEDILGEELTPYLDIPISSAVEKVVSMVGPQVKYPYERLAGETTFPDPFNRRPINPSEFEGRLFLKQFGLEWFYDKYTGRPTKDFGWFASGSIFYDLNINEVSYWETRNDAAKFQKDKTGVESSYFSPQNTIMGYYKKAIRLDIPELEKKYLDILINDYGMDEKDIDKKIDALSPLHLLDDKYIKEYIDQLSIGKTNKLDNAIQHYLDVYKPKNMDKELLYFQYRNNDLKGRIKETKDIYEKSIAAGGLNPTVVPTIEWSEIEELKKVVDKLESQGNPRVKGFDKIYKDAFDVVAIGDLRQKINSYKAEYDNWENNGSIGVKPQPLYNDSDLEKIKKVAMELYDKEDILYKKYKSLWKKGGNLLYK